MPINNSLFPNSNVGVASTRREAKARINRRRLEEDKAVNQYYNQYNQNLMLRTTRGKQLAERALIDPMYDPNYPDSLVDDPIPTDEELQKQNDTHVVIGQYGAAPKDLTGEFPGATTIPYKRIRPAKYTFVDPLKFGEAFGNYNRAEMLKNFDTSKDMALQQLDTELQGLRSFVPAASALKRSEISVDNQFNQQQRTQQLNQVLPEVRGQLAGQAGRAESFARGRVPDDITDRALELGIRSAAADYASGGGFGARSSVARKASDLMSAEQRIRLSQYGDQLLSANINQKAGLYLAPLEYSDAGSQIRVTPEVGAGRLAAQNMSELNQYGLIPAQTALSSQIQQNQFQTSLRQRTREFNKTNRVNVNMFNAQAKNQFALAKFNYMASLAGAYAGAAQTDINTGLGLAQQKEAMQIFQDHLSQAQKANQAGSISQLAGVALPILEELTGIFRSSSGGSGGGSGGGVSGGAGGFDVAPVPAEMPDVSAPQSQLPELQPIIPGDASGSVSTPVVQQSSGEIAPVPLQASVPISSFSEGTGLDLSASLANDPNQAITRSLINSSNMVLSSAGMSSDPGPGMQSIGMNTSGTPMFASRALLTSSDTSLGSSLVQNLGNILDPLGVYNAEDIGSLDGIAQVSRDISLFNDLSELQANGDTSGFVNTLLGRIGQPLIKELTDDPQNQSGLSSAFAAYNLYENWDRMSPSQKSMAVASLGIEGFKFSTGENLGAKAIISPVVENGKIISPGLSVSQAMNLFGAGVNVYGLAKNWDQLDAIQKITGGVGTTAQLANTAKSFGFLGAGTANAAVPGVTTEVLKGIGFKAAPQMGIGAGVVDAGASIPAGYTKVAEVGGQSVIAPASNAASAEGAAASQGGSLLGTAAGVAGVALGANQVYKGWGMGGSAGAKNGLLGGSAMAAGLYQLGATNPYALAGVMAVSLLGNTIKAGKSESQMQRDAVRSRILDVGLADKDYQITLADGSKADIGIDGHGDQHQARNPDMLVEKGNSTLNAWDIDYTNDLDYASGMGGIALARILTGSKETPVDQLGNQLGNAAIKNIGYGQDMTPENYNKMIANQRAMYAQSGIKSKADAYQLANQAFAEGRINETDLVTSHQAFNMIFDEDSYGTAQQLMQGRHRGAEVASGSEGVKSAKVKEPQAMLKPVPGSFSGEQAMEAAASLGGSFSSIAQGTNAPGMTGNSLAQSLKSGLSKISAMPSIAEISISSSRGRARLTKEDLKRLNIQKYSTSSEASV